MFEFSTCKALICGAGVSGQLPEIASRLRIQKLLVVTDPGLLQTGLVERVLSTLRVGPVGHLLFSDVSPDPPEQLVLEVADLARRESIDGVLGLGGGSSMDVAKLISVLCQDRQPLSEMYGVGNVTGGRLPLIQIPTTAGTGSEVTSVAVITDEKKGVKLPFTSSFLLPNAAIIDPRMTLTLPPHITAATAMDALTHATEAFTCMAKNPLSDAYATAAVKKVSQSLLSVMDNPKDSDGRLELAQGSTMAGIAFSNSMVGLVHSLGHTTGAICHLPHGLCMSLYLPYALEYNLDTIRAPLGELLLYLEGPEVYVATPGHRRAEASIAAIRKLRDQLYKRCQLPRTLKETGKVLESQLDAIAELALDDGSIMFNPKEVTLEDAREVLRRAWA